MHYLSEVQLHVLSAMPVLGRGELCLRDAVFGRLVLDLSLGVGLIMAVFCDLSLDLK